MPRKLFESANIRRLLGLGVLLTLGAGSGAVAGIANATQPNVASSQAVASQSAAAPTIEDSFVLATLDVAETPAPRSAPVATVAPAPKLNGPAGTAPRSVSSYKAPPTVSLPGVAALQVPAAAPVVQCDRLDDKKIYWLLDLAAKTRAANPGMDQAGAQVDGQLRGALGKNMCAAEAQRYVGAMCAEPAVYTFMQKMVDELPFFVRPMVGDPCTQDLVAVANKYLR